MIARDLERLLVDAGAARPSVDLVTRRLRACGYLPVLGRGQHAARIGAREAAYILMALAGSSAALKADTRLKWLLELRLADGAVPRYSHCLGETMELILGAATPPSSVSEIRISRTHDAARVIYRHHAYERYVAPDRADVPGDSAAIVSFGSEGVLSGGLLDAVRRSLLH